MMTNDKIALSTLLEKSSDASFLRAMIGFAAERLMQLETETICNAAPGERAPELDATHRFSYGREMSEDKSAFHAVAAPRDRELPTALFASSAVVIILIIGVLIGLHLPPGKAFQSGDLFRRLISWDGNWYMQIGNVGYSWNPAASTTQQDIAFFPVQGLIDKFANAVFGVNEMPAIVGIGLAMGVASIFSFEAFACRLIPDRAAAATWLFALWPTASFYLMGYPTGLTTICVIEALHASWRNKKWVAAGWLGLGTAIAPTVAFVAVAMALMQGIREMRRAKASWVLTWGLWCSVAFSGLLLFMAYQAVAFHDVRAFMQAQEGWGTSGTVADKLLRLLSPRTYLVGIRGSIVLMYTGTVQMIHGAITPGLYDAQTGFQIALTHLWFWMVLVGLLRFTRESWHRCQEIVLSGWCVCVGYVWFIMGGGQGVEESARLLFPATAFVFGLSGAGTRRRRFPIGLPYLAALSVIEVAFDVSGYNIL